MNGPRFRCSVISPDGVSRRVGGQGLLIGRDPACDIIVTDPSVSRRHALIRASFDGVELVPLGRLPVGHNGRPCERAKLLADGDRIEVAELAFTARVELPRPAGAHTGYRLVRGRSSFALSHTPFVAGGGDTDDLILERWPAGALRDPAGKPVRRALGSAMAKLSLPGCLLFTATLIGCSDDGTPDWPKLAAVPLTNPNGGFWGAQLSVGSQSFFVDVDTGSATTAVAGVGCSTCASVGVSPLYKPGATATDDRLPATSMYLDMSGWSGEVFTDRVGLGQGTPSMPLAIGDISTNLMGFFSDNAYQGILGLAAPEAALPHTGAYFDLAEQSGAVPTMAFELCPNDGTMWIGGFDATRAAAAPAYTPLRPISDQQPFYAVDVHSMSIGSTSVATAADFQAGPVPPVVDTGTRPFIAPQAVVTSTLAAINASPGFHALFGTGAKLGTLDSAEDGGCVARAGVTAAMVDAMLPPLTLTFPSQLAGSPDLSFTVKPTVSYLFDAGSDHWCFGILSTPDGTTILGDEILQAFVTIIDLQNQQVGWAPDRGCTLNTRRRAIERAAFRPRPPRLRPHHQR